ncbi:MAG: rod shape-determining protein RodA [Patescibacteria group bacterium]|jgi:rod shape determining protein RodA
MRHFFAAVGRIDWPRFSAALILIAFGFSALYSMAWSQGDSGFLLIKKQLVALLIGLVLVFLIIRSNYRWAKSFSLPLYLGSCGLLLLVLFFGETIRGTTGWFSVFGFHFQPVELAKLGVIVALARYFSDYRHGDFTWRHLFFSAAIVGFPVFLVLLQPDLGSALLLLGAWAIMLFFAGLRFKHFLVLSIAAGLTSSLAWFFVFADYQKARLISFLNPALDPMGEGYNVRQAIIAIGSGGLFGRGLGFGSQSQLRFVPESQTDFIYAVIAEEFGFFGTLLLFGAFFVLIRRLFRSASLTRDDFTAFLFIGTAALFLLSFLVNVGMNLGIMPVTGIALPFVSYGGSALIVSLVLLGLAESATVHDVTVKTQILGKDRGKT